MLTCPSCGTGAERGQAHCASCGATLPTRRRRAPVEPVAAAPGTPTCPSCNTPVEPGWRHCGSCGAALPVRRRPWQRIDWRSPVTLLAVAVAVLLLGGVALAGSERRFERASDDLAETRSTLREQRELVTALRGELGQRVVERDALRKELDSTKGSLTDAQRSVESQGKQLETFKACLGAIHDIVVALDEGDEAAAREAADRADRHCSEAEAFL